MEKAKLINIRESKKGKLIGEVQFEDGKTMPIPSEANLNPSLNNTECNIERKHGVITCIIIDEKVIFSKTGSDNMTYQKVNKKQAKKQPDNKTTKSLEAHAPYNFIPLNKHVIEAQPIPDFDCYYNEHAGLKRFNGYIDCEIESITPLYIRDTYTSEELIKKEKNNEDNADFFSPGGIARIPGSSLRGMTRTMVEIMSWGKFGFYENKRLFYRGLADKSNLSQEYQKNMSSYDRNTKKSSYKFNAGYLKRDGFDYYIIPAKVKDGKQFKQVTKRNKDEKFIIEKQQNGEYLVISGNINKKEHDWLIYEPDFNQRIPVSDFDIKEYMMDENRYSDEKGDGNLIRLISMAKDGMVPCFYVCWKDENGKDRVSFGHTGFFRLSYKYTIGDHIPENLKQEELIDIPESIFGKVYDKQSFASRIFFEDALLIPGQNNILISNNPITPKILSSPKPTTFQHYLEQPSGATIKNLNHWNNKNAKIRGYKLYWHKDGTGWELEITNEEKEKKKKIITKIKPVKPGIKFKSRVRFENLSQEELGALLFAIDLPENCYHKIGMGKPLGLGTIKIKPTLFLINRENRYTSLLEDENWNLGVEKGDIKKFKDAFEQYLLDKLNRLEKSNLTSLWDHERMKHLKVMLNFENTKLKGWKQETDYMELKEFKDRPVLPKPLEIYDKLAESK
ncbi:MAG TPA: TIGR03986 family CRISPR-associated RAMP protein [Thermoanaerobacter sp.]|nr:TIGR03986 family CRISPR-associated RAMP protein [Thermoanaerobacter sp.]